MSQELMNAIVDGNVKLALDIIDDEGYTSFSRTTRQLKYLDIDAQFKPMPDRPTKSTCLHESCRRGLSDITEKLLEFGASPNIENSWKATPLHFAATSGHLRDVEILLNHGALVLSTSIFGRKPCHQAAGKGHLEVVKCFLDHGFAINDQDTKKGYTLLHHAAKNGHIHVVKMLVGYGANVHQKDKDGKSALDLAKEECCAIISGRMEQTIGFGQTGFYSSSPVSSSNSKSQKPFEVSDPDTVDGAVLVSRPKTTDNSNNRSDDTTLLKQAVTRNATSSSFFTSVYGGSDQATMDTSDFFSSTSSLPESCMMSNTQLKQVPDSCTMDNDSTTLLKPPATAGSEMSLEDLVKKVKIIAENQENHAHRLDQIETRSESDIISCLECHPCQRLSRNGVNMDQLTATLSVFGDASVIRKKIQKNLTYIKENLKADDHIDYLLQEDALTMDDVELIESEKTESNRVSRMMRIFLSKRDIKSWVDVFITALRINSPFTQDMAKTILNTEP